MRCATEALDDLLRAREGRLTAAILVDVADDVLIDRTRPLLR